MPILKSSLIEIHINQKINNAFHECTHITDAQIKFNKKKICKAVVDRRDVGAMQINFEFFSNRSSNFKKKYSIYGPPFNEPENASDKLLSFFLCVYM